MKIEIDVQFNIGDKVLVKNPHPGIYLKQDAFESTIGGYVIHKNTKQTKVYYTLAGKWNSAISDARRKKKYLASELEKI